MFEKLMAMLLLIFLTAGSTAACGAGNEVDSSPRSEAPAPAAETSEAVQRGATVNDRLIAAYNGFGFDAFGQLAKADEGKNIFISPFSIAIALAMVYNGAAGETKQAMARALGLGEMSDEELNQHNLDLKRALQSPDSKVELAIANSLWARKGIQFRNDFLDRNRKFFGAQIDTLDFGDPQAPAVINDWVKSNTKGKIEKIIDQIDSQTVMFLINAIYFKGRWKVEFDKAQTSEDQFNLSDGKKKPVQMMFQTGKYPYYKGGDFQAVNLAYGEGRTSLYIFLPNEGVRLSDFLKGVNRKSWDNWMKQFRTMEGDIRLPRFKVEYEKTLNDSLKALGMESAFDPSRANFEGMRQQRDLYIQTVKHKAVVEVNEEGTEAAASTSVSIGITSVRSDKFFFFVNRPFFMAIRDNKTGAVLFMGAVTDPQ